MRQVAREEQEREDAKLAVEEANQARREEQDAAQREQSRVRTQARDELLARRARAEQWVAEAESELGAAADRAGVAAAGGLLVGAERVRDRLARELGNIDRRW